MLLGINKHNLYIFCAQFIRKNMLNTIFDENYQKLKYFSMKIDWKPVSLDFLRLVVFVVLCSQKNRCTEQEGNGKIHKQHYISWIHCNCVDSRWKIKWLIVELSCFSPWEIKTYWNLWMQTLPRLPGSLRRSFWYEVFQLIELFCLLLPLEWLEAGRDRHHDTFFEALIILKNLPRGQLETT